MNVLNLALEFALLMFLGIFVIKIKVVEADFSKGLSRLVMNVALPCLIFNSMQSQSYDGHPERLALLLGLSVAVMALLSALAALIWFVSGRGLFGRCTVFSTIFGNYTYMGLAVVQSLYGIDGMFVYTIFTLPVRLVFYAAPSFLMRGDNKVGEKQPLKKRIAVFLQPPTLAVLLGFGFYLTGLELPPVLSATVECVGDLASPLGMIICGMGLATASAKTIFRRPRPLIMVLARNFLAPALVIGFLYLLPIDSFTKQVVAIYAMVPVPSLITAFAIRYNCPRDVCEDCSTGVLLSTLLSILTLPMWANLANMVF